MVSALRSQATWLSYGAEFNLWERWHPVRPVMHWYNTRTMDTYINQELDERLSDYSESRKPPANEKSMVDLALQTYFGSNPVHGSSPSVDPHFKSMLLGQIKIFLFSGHDPSSSTLCYIFHLLAQDPRALQRVRDEHDQIFGEDPTLASASICQSPHLLNKLPFTIAVIKEALRLFPSVSGTRAGEKDFSLASDDGASYPTEGCLVWVSSQAMQRDPAYWPSPDEFIPERWLAGPDDPLYPTKGAWRPFEYGPRNCIGQELALLEMKVVMVMVLREFDIRSVYDEWDQLHPRAGPKVVAGERAYHTASGGPSEGLPCRVQRRSTRAD